MMKAALFGFVAGVVVAVAGKSFLESPIKTVVLIAVLCLAHAFTAESTS